MAKPETHIKRQGDSAQLPAQLAGRWGQTKVYSEENHIVLGRLEQPRQDKIKNLDNQSRTTFICTVLLESPFASVSTVSRGHRFGLINAGSYFFLRSTKAFTWCCVWVLQHISDLIKSWESCSLEEHVYFIFPPKFLYTVHPQAKDSLHFRICKPFRRVKWSQFQWLFERYLWHGAPVW